MNKRIDFHIHTFHSDGVMLPSEVIAKSIQMKYKAISMTDHADDSNLEELIYNFKTFLKVTPPETLEVFLGVELSYIYPEDLEKLAQKARNLGAQIILVHGESPIEPFNDEINQAAVEAKEGLIDIIAHPGFITLDIAKKAAEKGVFLELSSRKGHCLANGYIVKVAREAGAKMLVNSNAHTSSDLITYDFSETVARGAGLNDDEIQLVTQVYPEELIRKARLINPLI